jgi:hypothetical protein
VLKEDVPAKFGNGQVPSVSSLTGATATNGPSPGARAGQLTDVYDRRIERSGMERAETILRFILQAMGLAMGVVAAVLSALGETPFQTIGLFAGVGVFALGVAALSQSDRDQ